MAWTDLLMLAGFIAVCSCAAASGAIFKPGDWYLGLAKPSWVPPMWAFPVVWTILYIMISISGWMVWRKVGFEVGAVGFGIYLLQLVLNAAWSGLFFGMRRIDLAMIEVVVLWASVAALIVAFAPLDATAAWLLAPYLLWVTIAGVLNLSMLRLNPMTPPAVTQALSRV